MSVETTDLERSVLERKDRNELQTIATAMGAKPPSRARKAEIVDLILEAAGGGRGDDPDEHDADASGDAADDESEATAGGDHGAAEEGDDRRDDGGKQDARPKKSEKRKRGAAAADDHSSDDAGESHERDQQRQDQGGDPRGRKRGPNDSVESGNRRRRRRGRDRDKRDDEPWAGDPVEVDGYLDLRDEGYGFLRVGGFLPTKDDVYISVKQCRQLQLRKGDHVTGECRPANRNEKNPAMVKVTAVNGQEPDKSRGRPRFEDLTPLFPDERLRMETKDGVANMTARIIDLIAPIGKGQRGLIVSPPKAGKTTIMKQIAKSIELNNPEAHLVVLLVDERPEEVTDMARSLERGEVVASTFDRPAEEHTQVAELTIERAKRLVETGEDVVIILDGITRLARAYNLAAPANGRTLSGGLDTAAIYPPKKFFGAARNLEEGGSLTILATALVETGSKMDEVIFEEFKGTGNMELRLDRRLAERRVFPAIDVDASSTRHEELFFDRKQMTQVHKLRRVLHGVAGDGDPGAGLELMMDRLRSFRSNDEFLTEIAKG
ncbi:MAG: transcription termination factor Rho [Acidimicrobiales bacterium]